VSEPAPERHLSEIDLARLVVDAGEPPAHVAGCARCREALEHARGEAAVFARRVMPRTLPAIEARLGRRRIAWLVPATIALAAVAVWLVVLPRLRPDAERPAIAAKGSPVLHLVARRALAAEDRVFGVEPGAALAAGDAIRFVLDGADGRYLLVVSLDGAGQINVYYPYGGTAAAPLTAAGHVVLDGSIVLDDAPGPERIWAVMSDRAVAVDELRAQLSAIAAGGPAAIRSGDDLALPDVRQTSAWFEKSSQPLQPASGQRTP